MRRLFKFTIYLFFVLFAVDTSAQILNDTVSVYGARSTRYFYAKDFYDSVRVYHAIDTSFDRLHRYNYEYTSKGVFQDLGLMGTATKPVYDFLPAELGYQTGFNSYNVFHFYPQDIKFYDTKSPHSRINYVQGGLGEGRLEFELSRNISKKWNAGLNVRRLASRKTYGKTGNKLLDRLGDDYAVSLYTAYRTDNDRYGVLFTLSTLRHKVFETGGIVDTLIHQPTDFSAGSLNSAPLWFSTNDPNAARYTFDNRNQYHLYQHFHLDNTNKIGIYLETDYTDRYSINTFSPLGQVSNTNANYFKKYYFNRKGTDYTNNYKGFTNTLGLKFCSAFMDARVYMRRRDASYDELYNQDSISVNRTYFNDMFAGGEARIKYSEHIFIKGYLEQQVGFNQASSDALGFRTYPDWGLNRDNKKFGVGLQVKDFAVGYGYMKYAPTIMQTYFINNNFIWNNKFTSPEASTFYAKWKTAGKKYHLGFDVNYSDISNHIYFGTDSMPVQAKNRVNMFKSGFSAGYVFGKFHLDVNYIYANDLANADIIRVPEHYINPMFYFKGKAFKKQLDFAIGFDTRYASGYYADAYNPGTQQFFLQDKTKATAVKAQDYYLVDFFLDMKFRKTGIFVKGVNISQLWSGQAYYVTPYYPGVPITFTFGINWEFYD